MPVSDSIIELLNIGVDAAPAIQAPGRTPISFYELRHLAREVGHFLRDNGIKHHDTVAIVLPNGPEMASAFAAISSFATSAPLNPTYRADEFNFYLSDLNAKAIVVKRGDNNLVRDVAKDKGIPILEIIVDEFKPAGHFIFANAQSSQNSAQNTGFASPENIALVLHTSGTTSRPKMVPLSQSNVCASARHIKETLNLSPEDRCLNVMPLFHIHGLIAAVISSLGTGASVFCAPEFNALRFFQWLEESQATWFTAVPTMHQAILTRAPRNLTILKESNLRLIRSSSASLPPNIMSELEETFGCPVIESYGMTEATHQMTSNQLPPGLRKPGTVGRAAGPEVSIMSEEDTRLLPTGRTGEVVIRGPNVASGYINNAQANKNSYQNGWFRTGDQGFIDGDGYLNITGRLKEIINRGGEKISPREIDEILLDHPGIIQAVTFGIPHKRLGEDVAAAIVLVKGQDINQTEIRAFANERLASFKVPRKIVIVEEIPKGATGKVQRIGLAAKLGLIK